MAFLDDFTVNFGHRYIRHTSGNAVYSALTMYSELQDLFDDLNQMDDQVPMSAQTPTEFTMINGWFVDQASLEYIKGGAITSSGWASGEIVSISYDADGGSPDVGFAEADVGRIIEGATTTDTGRILHFDQRFGTDLGVVWIRPDDPATDLFDNVTEDYNTPADTAYLETVDAAIADDGGVFTDETTAANEATADDMTLLPATPVVNDAYYFGDAQTFGRMELDASTQGAGTWTIVWEYWDGTTWVDLATSHNLVDGTSGFTAAVGRQGVTFDTPSDWATTTVNSQGPFYYIRARVSAFTSITTQPLGQQAWMAARGQGLFSATYEASAARTGESIYTNIFTLGTIQAQDAADPDTKLYVLQDGSVLAEHASATEDNTALGAFGQLDILVKTQEQGTVTDNGELTVFARKPGTNYDWFATRNNGGRVPIPFSTSVDSNDQDGTTSFDGSSGQGTFVDNETFFQVASGVTDATSEDGAAFADETADFNSATADDVSPFPTMAASDNFYVGFTGRFGQVALNVGTAGDHDATLTLEYSQDGGTWAALTNVQTSAAAFEQLETAGFGVITFNIPDDWEQVSVDGGPTAYFIRWNVSAFTSQTTPPLISQGWVAEKGIVGYVTLPGVDSNAITEYFPLGDSDLATSDRIFGTQSAADTTVDTIDTSVNATDAPGNTITIDFARISRDLNNGAGAQPYDVEVDLQSAIPIQVAYQRMKFETRRGETTDIDTGAALGIPGEEYKGAELRIDYSGGAGAAYSVGDILRDATTGGTGIVMGIDAVASGFVILTASKGTFDVGNTLDDTLSGGTFTATIDTVAAVQSPKAAPFGTFAGGTFFGAPCVWLANVNAGDEQAFQLIDCNGTAQVPPNSVSIQVTSLTAGDTVSVFQRDTNGDVLKTDAQTPVGAENAHSVFNLAAGNNAGDTTVVIATDGETNTSIQNDNPDGGSAGNRSSIRVIDNTFGDEQRYRYSSFAAATFTLAPVTDGTGTSDAGSSNTVITDTGVSWSTGGEPVRVGDIIRNVTDDEFAYVVSVDSDTQLTTTALPTSDWGAKSYEINRLVRGYAASDDAYVPLLDRVADTATEASSIIQSGDISVLVRVRFSGSSNPILPFEASNQVNSGGMSQAAIRNEDTIAT